MKKILFILLLLPFISLAQKIDGIGFLKLHKTTTEDIDSLRGTTSVIELTHQIDEEDKDKGFPCIDNHKAYNIDELDVARMQLKDLRIDFYNDTLYNININTFVDRFEDNLVLKYGKPLVKSISNTINCVSVFGHFAHQEVSEEKTYRNDNISAQISSGMFYDENCNKELSWHFNLTIKKINQKVFALEKIEMDKKKIQWANEKKKALQQL